MFTRIRVSSFYHAARSLFAKECPQFEHSSSLHTHMNESLSLLHIFIKKILEWTGFIPDNNKPFHLVTNLKNLTHAHLADIFFSLCILVSQCFSGWLSQEAQKYRRITKNSKRSLFTTHLRH